MKIVAEKVLVETALVAKVLDPLLHNFNITLNEE